MDLLHELAKVVVGIKGEEVAVVLVGTHRPTVGSVCHVWNLLDALANDEKVCGDAVILNI